MAHQYNGCPLLGHFGRRIVELTAHVRIRQSVLNNMEAYKREAMQKYLKTPLPEFVDPPAATRALVEQLYNIPVEDQRAFEAAVNNITLDVQLSFSFILPPCWDSVFENYTHPLDQEWQAPFQEDHTRLRAFIGEFGKTTVGFMRDYYLAG